MRVAPKVLVLVRDAAGYGAALADALRPTPGLTRESAPLELPLAKYGLDGEKASGELVNFSDFSGDPQASNQNGLYVAILLKCVNTITFTIWFSHLVNLVSWGLIWYAPINYWQVCFGGTGNFVAEEERTDGFDMNICVISECLELIIINSS
ncbi:hypothetical protein OsI_07825 [Oryza sativa Indica Group]|uniref:DUF7894 domain-containing protein n=1 Tax=Oryza sativa subsp. indica TaxID=39946 RepID=A2X6I3_ORYSI|nr:hypothetical protein OsI_07825 [Oryza sativa Indica Group]